MASKQPIDVVVIGGSAGAITALEEILPSIPATFAPAIVIVLHMLPSRPSHLAEVLAAKAHLPVSEADDKEPIQRSRIYVASPGYHLLIEKVHTFAYSVDEPVHFSRPSIDVLFESAAEAYGAAIVGVLLSGANDDGARGLAQIAAGGGITIVQDPSGARAREMPDAALLHLRPDHVAMPRDIGMLLAECRTRPVRVNA